MNRQEVAISLAQLNLINKKVSSAVLLNQGLCEVMSQYDLTSIQKIGDDILLYLKKNPCQSIMSFIDTMYDIEQLRNILSCNNKVYLSQFEYMLLTKLVDTNDRLNDFATLYKTMYRKGKLLEDIFENERAIELFQRAQKAGFLDNKYQLTNKISNVQIRTLAYAISEVLGIKPKERYKYFQRQWNINDIAKTALPELYSKTVEAIKKLYPEVDFSPLTGKNDAAYFEVPYPRERMEELFMSLIMLGYIDKKTKLVDFMKMFRIGDVSNRIPVNWIREQRCLSFFVKHAFQYSNKDIWMKAQNCFTIKGHTPNRQGLKSSMATLVREKRGDDFDLCLKSLCDNFNRE